MSAVCNEILCLAFHSQQITICELIRLSTRLVYKCRLDFKQITIFDFLSLLAYYIAQISTIYKLIH